jgi:hypothetical protein
MKKFINKILHKNQYFEGIIVEESLSDNRIINNYDVIGFEITLDDDIAKRWHLFKICIRRDQISDMQFHIKQGWYMHFWSGHTLIVVFKEKSFEIDRYDRSGWNEAVEYGLKIGISKEQLDFVSE